MLIVDKEERAAFTTYMEAVACTLLRQSEVDILKMSERHTKEEILSSSQIIGQATGQVVLDKVIEITKDMSRDELLRYMTEATCQAMMQVMNAHPEYRMKIQMLSAFED